MFKWAFILNNNINKYCLILNALKNSSCFSCKIVSSFFYSINFDCASAIHFSLREERGKKNSKP